MEPLRDGAAKKHGGRPLMIGEAKLKLREANPAQTDPHPGVFFKQHCSLFQPVSHSNRHFERLIVKAPAQEGRLLDAVMRPSCP
jgi:hypothetical protein